MLPNEEKAKITGSAGLLFVIFQSDVTGYSAGRIPQGRMCS
jgi:hypothetical protein